MQSSSKTRGKLVSKRLALGFLLLLLATSMLLAPRSEATRQRNTSINPESQAIASQKRGRPEFVPGEALVRFKKNRAFEGAQHLVVPNNDASVQALQKSGSQGLAASTEQVLVNVERFEGSDLVDGLRIARMAPDDTIKAVAAFQARDDVLYAEPNYILHGDVTPNDPSFGQLYGLTKIGAPQAWDITTGNRSVVVGVVDEGIDINHPDLLANIWTNPSPGSISGISGDLHGYDFRDNTGTITAESHATHVAGTIGAVGNNGVGVVGVNWQVSLMSLRFISQAANSGTDADAIKAYNYAKQMRDLWVSSSATKGANIRVLNASYGGGGYSQAAADALNAVGQSGILFVAAAGNESSDADLHPHYPSGYSLANVVSVSATDQNDSLAGFSNFGSQRVLLGAPGVGILSTTPNNTYSSFSGTSMATPHVAGAAALLCAANPNLSVNQLRALLSFNGDILPALQGKTLSGRRLNVFKSLQAINEGDTTPPGTVGGFQVASQNGRTANLSWTASGDDGSAGQASLYDISFVDQTTNALVPLTTLAPAISGAAQNISVNLPYRHLSGTIRLREFDNVGNEGTPATVSINVSPDVADPYTATLNSAAPLSTGGTALALTFDDRYRENYPLPFTFSFFGQLFNTVTISTNGNLYFSTPPKRTNGDADDVPSSVSDLSQFKMIAGMWDDLDLSTSRRADADVYVVQPNSSTIIFRWQGVPCNDQGSGCTGGSPINFEIELRNDGTVTTRYGSGNINLFPVVGISAGEPDAYVVDALTSELSPKTLTNAQSAVFTPKSPCGYSLSPTSQTFGASGGSGSLSVSTQGGCNWSATSNASWVTITAGASGTGNGSVNYSVAPNSVSLSRSGTVTIAGQFFTVNQDAAPSPTPTNQTITFGVLSNKTYLDPPFAVSASASSGLPVSFSILSGPATISGNTITITGAGTVAVRASQSGNANFNAAPNVDQSFTVGKAGQAISFGPLSSKVFGDAPFALSATSSSGLPVSFSIVSGPATISGNTVTMTGAGTVVVRASQSGDANFNAAPNVDQSFTVGKAGQTINFGPLAPRTYGDPFFNVNATSSSNLPVSFSILSGPATISSNTITITGAGTVAVRASQAGDANFNAAPNVDQSFNVGKASQTISFGLLSSKVFGDAPFALSATSSSGLPVSFQILSGPATISGNTVSINGTGTVTVRATQAGNSNYNAASFVDQPFNVVSAVANISLTNLASTYDGTAKFATATTSPPNLNVNITYSQKGSPVPAPISSGAYDVTATITSPGFSGTTTGTLVINKATPVITWNNPANISFGTPLSGAQLNATANVPGSFVYNALAGTVLSVGTYQLWTTFTPSDLNYDTVAASVQLTVDPTPFFSSATYSVNESAGSVTLTVMRSGDASGAASVGFVTSDSAGAQNCSVFNGNASSRCDYLTSIGTVQFAAGESSKTFSIPIIDDSYHEGNETFTVSLNNALGASLGTPSVTTVMIVDDDSVTGPNNPIDQSSFFVRQHYLDFLNREPDTSGLNFWVNNIESCGADANCRAVKRIDTSAAFFLSIEFQETGYLVERLYKAAYGDVTGMSTLGGSHQISVPVIRLSEFLPDTQRIGQGVVVNVGNWQQQLEINKQAFTLEFVQRSRFMTALPTLMTPSDFVTRLFINAGVLPTFAERQAAINEFGSAATTTADVAARSRALRDVAENSTLNQQEFNRAFVLMQFFGYLRRNPNDPQDTDYTGYDFWLTKLNQFNGNYLAAEMVKSFLVAGEYRQRFGP